MKSYKQLHKVTKSYNKLRSAFELDYWSSKPTDEEHNMDDITQLQHKSKR